MKPPICAFFPLFLTLFSTSVYCAIKLNFGFNLPPFVLQVPRFKLPPIKITASFKPSHHGSPFAIQFPGISVNTHDHEEQWGVPYSEPWPQPEHEPEHEPEPEPKPEFEPEPEAPVYHREQSYWAKSDLLHNYREDKRRTGYERPGGGPQLSIKVKSPDQLTYLHQGSTPRVSSDRKRQPSQHQTAPWDRWVDKEGESTNHVRLKIQQSKLKKRSGELSTGQHYGANVPNIALTKKKI